MLNRVHVMVGMQVLVIACMALLWLSGAVHGYERGTARSGVLEMCENELGTIVVARMSSELCSVVCKQLSACKCCHHMYVIDAAQWRGAWS